MEIRKWYEWKRKNLGSGLLREKNFRSLSSKIKIDIILNIECTCHWKKKADKGIVEIPNSCAYGKGYRKWGADGKRLFEESGNPE